MATTEEMVAWFFQNFEDPAENCPYESAEGGYQWIWGGPCSAEDELTSHFGGKAKSENIKAAIELIEDRGFDWSPVPTDEDCEPTADDGDHEQEDG